MKISLAQKEMIMKLRKYPDGYDCSPTNSTLNALERKGLVVSRYSPALFANEWALTEAGDKIVSDTLAARESVRRQIEGARE